MTTFLAGLALGLSLIVAIGAQNVFVLRQGLRREHLGVVIAICAISDAALIAAGVAGVGEVMERFPGLLTAVRWAGAVFLFVYGAMAAWRAFKPSATALNSQDEDRPKTPLVRTVVACLAITWLNPHVYLDTVFLLGSIASTHEFRWVFAAGAMTGSVLWFSGLGLGAKWLQPLLATARAWRILDGLIALVMWAIAVSLVVGS